MNDDPAFLREVQLETVLASTLCLALIAVKILF